MVCSEALLKQVRSYQVLMVMINRSVSLICEQRSEFYLMISPS